ncbi:MAG: OmpH family outer membrane protein [Gemmatimonadota bacterium]
MRAAFVDRRIRTHSATETGDRRCIGRGAALALVLLLAGAGSAAAQEPAAEAAAPQDRPLRIAVLNFEEAAARSPAGRDLQARLEEFQARIQGSVDSLEATARAVQQRIGAAPDTISDEERQAFQQQYLAALTAYQTYRQDRQREAQQMQQEGFTRIKEQIGPVLQAIQEEEGYDLVLNTRSSAVLVFSDRIDITQQVIARLEAASPEAETPPTGESPPPGG